MPSYSRMPRPRTQRRVRQLRPCLMSLEERVVPSVPGIAGITFDSSGNVYASYDSTAGSSTRQESIGLFSSNGYLVSSSVIGTPSASAVPGALAMVGSSASLPSLASGEILELQPNGQLFAFNPTSGTSPQYDNLANDSLIASKVFDAQTGSTVNLTGQISLKGATYGDFGIYRNSLVVSAESNNWDFVVRLTYGASAGSAVATVLVASPANDGLSAAPGGVAVDSQGTVLTTLPYLPAGSSTAIHVAVGFNLFYDSGSTPAPVIPKLGLTTVPNINSGGIAVDAQDNFILAASDSSLYGGGPGIVHINSALTAFLADSTISNNPTTRDEGTPTAIALQNVGGTTHMAFTGTFSNPALDTYTIALELSLFSGQVSPAQLRHAYGIDQIQFTSPSGTKVTGDGTGQTIAIVEEGVDPTLEADLKTFDQYFGIPDPPSFQVVDQNGVTTRNLDIVGEASLDVEWAHAVAPGASIVVYNSAYNPNDLTTSSNNLLAAVNEASRIKGVSVVTLSYGGVESGVGNEQALDASFTTPGVTFLAASGDSGIYGNGGNLVAVNYPAASPNVVAVGGTSITIDSAGNYPGTGPTGEIAWSSGGGGVSNVEAQPAWQSSAVSASYGSVSTRAVPDVSIDSGSAQEYDVFASTVSGSANSIAAVGWLGDVGTSAASPIWAGLIAIADQGRVLAGGTTLTGNTQTLPALYQLPAADFHDIVNGSNGYSAGPGYDLSTGLGTPVANLLVPDLAGYQMTGHASIKTEPPANVNVASTFGLTVQVTDRLGSPVNGGTVAVALGNNPGNATLGGTLTAPIVNGLASFSDLTLSQQGTGYTLTVTGSAISGALTTTAITVTAVGNATQINVTALPTAPVFGQAVTLTATVAVVNPATGLPTGSVTFEQGSTILGTEPLTNGVAQLTWTPAAAGTQTITVAYGGDVGDQPSSTLFLLPVSPAPATLTLSNLSLTYDGSPQAAVVTTSPAGLSGVTLTYAQNGVAVANPTHAGNYQVTAALANPNYRAQAVTGTLVIGQATPTITWAAPANITVGTPLGAGQLDAIATLGGTPVPGVFHYTPSAGTVLPTGNGQTLGVTFTPTDTADFQTVASSVPINVVPKPVAMVIHAQPVFQRASQKSTPVLTGFTLQFNRALAAAALKNPANYQLGVVAAVKVKKKIQHVLQPFKSFTVSYTPATHTVTLKLIGAHSFPLGGRLSILSGVTSGSGSVLGGSTVFTITAGGKTIVPS